LIERAFTMHLAKVMLAGGFALCGAMAYADPHGKDAGESSQTAPSAASTNPYLSGSAVLRPQFQALDRDGDAVLSKTEIEAYPRATSGQFEQADKDRDGKLDYREFRVLHANTSTDRRLGSR
jgi:hypothetical protein